MALRIGAVELVADTKCEVGESPRWHTDANLLYFADITAGTIYQYDPSRAKCQPLSRGNVTGGLTIQKDGSLLLFQDRQISVLGLDGLQHEVANGLCPENERFNEVIADPEGRVYATAMGGNGRLFCFDPDGKVTELLDGLGIPNGMGFTPDLKSMYFTDSTPRRIYKFDYEQETGEIANRRLFAEIPESEGLPDGMTMDAEGYIWTAVWFGGRVKRYARMGDWIVRCCCQSNKLQRSHLEDQNWRTFSSQRLRLTLLTHSVPPTTIRPHRGAEDFTACILMESVALRSFAPTSLFHRASDLSARRFDVSLLPTVYGSAYSSVQG
jgi:sugar lactone lactonase YvrE